MSKILTPDWSEVVGQRVRLYRNLKNRMISVQIKLAGKGWRVVGHLTNATLSDITFPVNETKRQYIIRVRNKRDVCAYAEGVLQSEGNDFSEPLGVEVDFNPFLSPHFFERGTGRILHPCQSLQVRDGRVYVSADALLEEGCIVTLPVRSQSNLQVHAFWKQMSQQPVWVTVQV